MRVLFTTLGSVGDFKPCLHLGIGLKRIGHEVIMAGNRGYGRMASQFELDFVPITEKEDLEQTLNPDFSHSERGLAVTKDQLIRGIKPVLDFIEAHHLPGETVVVAPTRVLGARLAQELWHIPLVSIHMAPLYLTTFDGFAADITEAELGPDLDGVRAELGLYPRFVPVVSWQFSPQKIACMFPQWFAKPAANWPLNTHLLDFTLIPDQEKPPADVQAFLDAGDAPLVFSPGTYTRDTSAFFESAQRICEQLGKRAVFTPVYVENPLPDLPDTILGLEWVNYHALLPHCAAIIHAGGIGACAEGIRAAIPQMLIPAVFDQRDNARRMVALNAAHSMTETEFQSPQAAQRIAALLADQRVSQAAVQLQPKLEFNPAVYGDFDRILRDVLRK